MVVNAKSGKHQSFLLTKWLILCIIYSSDGISLIFHSDVIAGFQVTFTLAFFHQRWEDFGSFEDCVVLSQERLSTSLYVVWLCDFYVLWTGFVSFQRNIVTTRGGVDEI